MTDFDLVRRAVETAPMVDGVERQTARAQLRALLDRAAAVERVEAELDLLDRIAGSDSRSTITGRTMTKTLGLVRAALDGSGVAE